MKTRKRILSIFLTLALTAGLLAIAPITASAAPASIDVSTLLHCGQLEDIGLTPAANKELWAAPCIVTRLGVGHLSLPDMIQAVGK